MADSKRQSTGNRVATPKLSSQGPVELDTALSKAIGARVKIVTAAPAGLTLEGTLFTACPVTNIIAVCTTPSSSTTSSASSTPIQDKPASQIGDYHLIPVSRIQTFNVVAPASTNVGGGFETAVPPIAALDKNALEAKEKAAIRKIKERDATRGKGVGKEGQEIFDALARTLPTRWHETSIIVNDSVIIAKPYRLEDCSAPAEQRNSLARVKKVLENERRKIAERNKASSKVAVPAAVGNVRKGG